MWRQTSSEYSCVGSNILGNDQYGWGLFKNISMVIDTAERNDSYALLEGNIRSGDNNLSQGNSLSFYEINAPQIHITQSN